MPDAHESIVIGLQPNTRALRLERVRLSHLDVDIYEDAYGYWLLWINTIDFLHGTYLALHDDGRVKQVTIDQDGSVHVIDVKEADECAT